MIMSESQVRRAVVQRSRNMTAREVAAYLPSNYKVVAESQTEIIIEGTDEAGWTLHEYVIPRLASGLIFAEEMDTEVPDYPPVELVPATDEHGNLSPELVAVLQGSMVTQATPDDAGCLVDGHWGQYALAQMVGRAAEYGYRDHEVETLAARHLASRGPGGGNSLSNDEFEVLADGAEDAEQWLNDFAAPDGYSFGWHEGEFFLWSDEQWEESS